MARQQRDAEALPPRKPRVFIGSSTEGKPIAEEIQLGLKDVAECTIWSQGVFGVSQGYLESLVKATGNFDFAVLVATPDDAQTKRGKRLPSPRDNVVFELGLFMGALGRDRTCLVYCSDRPIDLPSDLAGMSAATYPRRSDDNLAAELGPVCTQLKSVLRQGVRERSTGVQVLSSADRDPLFEEILRSSLHVICRAASLPATPSEAKLRVFIFRYQNKQLVCTHFYDADQAEEVVGETCFDVSPKIAKKIVVVEAFLKKRLTRRVLKSTGEGTPGVHGKLSSDIKGVLAQPIMKDGEPWGVVDFDAGTEVGLRMIESEKAGAAIYAIASHLALLVP